MANHEAFGSMTANIDPNRVITPIKDNNRGQEVKEISIVNGEAAQSFAPMQWPLFDDGKPITTNAIGYEIGGYFKRHQEALKAAQAEADRKAEEERLAAEKAAQEAEANEKKDQGPTVSVEELEAMRNAARNEGYAEGLNSGHEEGYQKGLEQGKAEGFAQGQQDGMSQGYEDGFRQGRDEGFAKGQEAGIASGNDIVTTQADRFRHLADMLATPLRELDEQVTDELVYLVSRLAKVLLKREIKGDTQFLKESIEKCISLLPEAKEGAEIMLSEGDYALMIATIGKDYMQAQNWRLTPMSNMQDGDVLVNTKTSSAQWRVDDRIDALISDFLAGSADAVSSARKESIPGCPDYDEAPKKALIPPRNIMDLSDRIAKNMAAMAPQPHFADTPEQGEAPMPSAAASSFDPDAAELNDATTRSQADAALAANATAIDQSLSAGDGADQQTPPPTIAEQAAAHAEL